MDLPFLNPWLLAGGVAVAGPVLIHLFNRQKVRNIEWGAMMLLRRVVKVRSRRVRIEDILLMLLRCLIVALVVLAAARPVTKLSGIVKSPNVAVVVAIDSSMSMKHSPGVKSRFDLAKDRAREIFRTIEPGTPASLVLLGKQTRVLLNGTGYDSQTFEHALASAEAADEPLNLDKCLPDLSGLLTDLSAPSRELYIITDAHKTTWANLSAPAKQSLAQLHSVSRALIVPVQTDGDRNLAVTRLEIAAGLPQVGALVRFEADVANFSHDSQDGGQIMLNIDGEAVDRAFVGPLKGGERKTVPIYATFRHDGIARISAQIGDDALADDNARYVVVNVRRNVHILCVNGQTKSLGYNESAGGFVASAFAPGRLSGADSPVQVESISWLALPTAKLSDYDAIAMIDVPDVSDQMAGELKTFVGNGGGLIVFPGGGTHLEAWNEHLARGAAPLLPAELVQEDANRISGEGVAIDWQPSDHPILKALRSLPGDLLAETRLFRTIGARPNPQGHAILKTAAGEPVLLEQSHGRGRVLLFTTSPDRQWSNLAVNPAFPLMMQHAMTYLIAQPYEKPLELPDALVLPISVSSATIVGSDGSNVPATVETRNGEQLLIADLPQPGFYSVVAGKSQVYVAANAPTAESDVSVVTPDELRGDVDGTSAQVVSPDESIASAAAISRRGHELAPALMIAAVGLFLIEAVLSRWYTGRSGKRLAA